ncbi:hypothetical protein B0H13DRAFT_1930341 [Mycena leptocephala]|nr:hypothetical protein B0H13DRAFT_1930341 [Mycena leptocephala]
MHFDRLMALTPSPTGPCPRIRGFPSPPRAPAASIAAHTRALLHHADRRIPASFQHADGRANEARLGMRVRIHRHIVHASLPPLSPLRLRRGVLAVEQAQDALFLVCEWRAVDAFTPRTQLRPLPPSLPRLRTCASRAPIDGGGWKWRDGEARSGDVNADGEEVQYGRRGDVPLRPPAFAFVLALALIPACLPLAPLCGIGRVDLELRRDGEAGAGTGTGSWSYPSRVSVHIAAGVAVFLRRYEGVRSADLDVILAADTHSRVVEVEMEMDDSRGKGRLNSVRIQFRE